MVRRCVKKTSTQEYAAKIINTKKLSARGECSLSGPLSDYLSRDQTSADALRAEGGCVLAPGDDLEFQGGWTLKPDKEV